MHDYLNSGNNVDLSGRFVRSDAGDIVFSFGKHQGKRACTQLDYLQWMLNGDFAIDTKMVANRIYKNCIWEEEIKAWLSKHKVLDNKALASALYTTIKFGPDVFPFATSKEEEKTTLTYLIEPPSSYVLQHKDAVDLLIKQLDAVVSEEDKKEAKDKAAL